VIGAYNSKGCFVIKEIDDERIFGFNKRFETGAVKDGLKK
jgi:hypothetical protein